MKKNLISYIGVFFLTVLIVQIAQAQTATWDYTSGSWKVSAHTLERAVDGNIIYTYGTGTVHFGVSTGMSPSPATTQFVHGVRITNGVVELYENGVITGTSTSIGSNLALKIERRGSVVTISKGTTATGGTFTTLYTRATDANLDWHPILYDQTGNHSAHIPLITFSGNKEGFLPDYFGNGMSSLSNLTTTYCPAYDSLTYRQTYNWIFTTTYNGEGRQACHELSQSIAYFDDLGREVQSQTKDYTDAYAQNKVWVTQNIFDRYGRQAIRTLPAPKTGNQIGYASNFVRSGITTANPYGLSDFDDSDNYFNPAKVGNVAGTLGAWYYNTDVTSDPGRPATEYPFMQTEYSPLSGSKRFHAQPGEAYRMGLGRYEGTYAMQAGNELTYVFGQRHPLALAAGSTIIYDSLNTLSGYTTLAMLQQYTKVVTVDVDGKQSVTFNDREGKEVAKCLAGKVNGVNAKIQTTTMTIPGKEYRDIHITDQGSPNTTVTFTGGATYVIYNLATYSDFNNISVAGPTSVGTQSLGPGFYRIMNVSSGTTPPTCTLSYNLNYHTFSLQINDLNGKMIASIPPKAVQYNTTANSATPPAYTDAMRSEFTWIRYNTLNQKLWEKSPDAGLIKYYYRNDGKLRFSMNADQRTKDRFSYIFYGSDGRVREKGEAYLAGIGAVASTVLASNVNVATNLPTGAARKEYVSSTYDEPFNTPPGKTARNLFGRTSYSEKFAEDGSSIEKIWYSYDHLGRLEWTGTQINSTIGTRFTEFKYDLLGNITETTYDRNNSGEFRHLNSYNNEGQIRSVSTRRNGLVTVLPEISEEYTYYQTGGDLKSIKYHNNFKEQFFSYTLQGHLKAINGGDFATLSPSSTSLFSQMLDYYPSDFQTNMAVAPTTIPESGGTTAYSYSGNISRQRWKAGLEVSGFSQHLAYTYQYNHRNELVSGLFATAGVHGTAPYQYNYSNNYREFGITYDLNGNLLTLSRNDAAGATLENYAYNLIANTNKLSHLSGVFNGSPTNNYLKAQAAGNYTFNNLGQVTQDNAQQIKTSYDPTGKVTKITDLSNNPKVEFSYSATGERIQKTAYSGSVVTKTYYHYAGKNIMSIYKEVITSGVSGGIIQTELPLYGKQGRVGNVYPGTNYTYRYDLKDHLGNVRVVFGRSATSYTTLVVDYYADYYPYGWELPGRSSTATSYRYGYQGRFAEKDPESGFISFSLRQYDSRLGRWQTIDPAMEFFSPYVGFGNNPLKFADPSGGTTYDNIYRNQAGDIIAVVRTNAANDNFYTIDNAGNITFDRSRLRTNGWIRLTDYQKNAVINRSVNMSNAPVNLGRLGLNENGLSAAQSNRLVAQGLQTTTLNNGRVVAVPRNVLIVLNGRRYVYYDTYDWGASPTNIHSGMPVDPSVGGAYDVATLPTTGIIPPNSLNPNLTITIKGAGSGTASQIVNLTDGNGNLLPVDMRQAIWRERAWRPPQ